MSSVALITIAHGRHTHWALQQAGVARSTRRPDARILVAMDDPALADAGRSAGATVVELAAADGAVLDGAAGGAVLDAAGAVAPSPLPLARARNLGAAAALEQGADVLVFLDVDCVPAPALVDAYADAAGSAATRDRLLCGPVTYLEPAPAGGYDLDRLAALDAPHPARPAPAPGEVELGGSHDLFWSLSFALTGTLWERIGGFHEGYVGYGGEDTDFAWAARAAGIELAWVGGARAYHQHHPVEDPPVRHLDDILRNGALFRERWGVWPMRGWLDAFVDDRLVERTADGGYRRPR